MTADVKARVEAAILAVLADGRPRTGWEIAEALRATPGALADADRWSLLLSSLRAAGRLACTSERNRVVWAVARPPRSGSRGSPPGPSSRAG